MIRIFGDCTFCCFVYMSKVLASTASMMRKSSGCSNDPIPPQNAIF